MSQPPFLFAAEFRGRPGQDGADGATVLPTDEAITALDADAGSLFRIQSDARHTSSIDARTGPVELASRYATSGAGTLASPWVSASGTGGIKEAIEAAKISGNPVKLGADYYRLSATVDNFESGMTILTEGVLTVMVPDAAIADGLAFYVQGTAEAYLTDITIGGYHTVRSGNNVDQGAGVFRTRYVKQSHFGLMTAEGAGGGVLSLRSTTECVFDGVLARDVGLATGSGLFTRMVTKCHFGPIIVHGGQEAADLGDGTNDNQFDAIISFNSGDEGLDIGSSRDNQFGLVKVINPGVNGVSMKSEVGATDGNSDCTGNHIDVLHVEGHTAVGLKIYAGIDDPASLVANNTVGKATIISTETGAEGVTLTAGSLDPPVEGVSIGPQSRIVVPGVGFTASKTTDVSIDGYIESTGAKAVFVDYGTRPKVRGKVKSGETTATAGAVHMSRCTDQDVEVTVISAAGNGIGMDRVKGGRALMRGGNCQHHGIYLRVRDEADWRGPVNIALDDSHIKNVNLASASRWGMSLINDGATVATGIAVRNNSIEDDQAVATSNGISYSGAFDYGYDNGNLFRALVQNRLSAQGANSINERSPNSTTYGSRSLTTGVEYTPSTTRPTLVVINPQIEVEKGEEGTVAVRVGPAGAGVLIPTLRARFTDADATNAKLLMVSQSCTFMVPPGQTYKVTAGNTAGTPTFTLGSAWEFLL